MFPEKLTEKQYKMFVVRRGGGGKDKMKPCSPRRIFCLLFCIKATKRSDLMNSLINKFNDE